MNRQACLAAILIAFAAGAGGAAAETFRAADRAGGNGYFDQRIEENGRWIVGYTAAPGQSDREVAEYALRRAGELAAEQSQDWFAVIGATERTVEFGAAQDDLALRAGHFIKNPPATFGGGGSPVPNVVLERWQPRRVRQQILIIQLGSGDQASFPDLEKAPEIFPAAGG